MFLIFLCFFIISTTNAYADDNKSEVQCYQGVWGNVSDGINNLLETKRGFGKTDGIKIVQCGVHQYETGNCIYFRCGHPFGDPNASWAYMTCRESKEFGNEQEFCDKEIANFNGVMTVSPQGDRCSWLYKNSSGLYQSCGACKNMEDCKDLVCRYLNREKDPQCDTGFLPNPTKPTTTTTMWPMPESLDSGQISCTIDHLIMAIAFAIYCVPFF